MIEEIQQNYNNYIDDHHDVWRLLYNRQLTNLYDKAPNEFLYALIKLNYDSTKIPRISRLNASLSNNRTPFTVIGVNGIVDDGEFFELLRNDKFPVTIWQRRFEQVDYIEEPDIFHDAFGHVPMLMSKPYWRFLKKLAEYAEPIFKSGDKERQDMVVRMYWYTIEFGLLKQDDEFKVYGAGILSSFGETKKVFNPRATKVELSNELLSVGFDKTNYQDTYAYINGGLDALNNIELNF